jgi:ABC-2 type transport system permease protein
MPAKAKAFFLRDLRAAVTYRVSFVETFVGMIFGLVSMLFISDLIDQGSPADLAPYGNDYFGFALIGVAFALFAQVLAGQFAGIVRSAQVTGTLEVMLSSRTSLPAFLGYSSLYGFAYAVLRLVVALSVGAIFLGANLNADDAAVALLAFILTVATFAGIGIFAAAFVVWFKQPEPITAGLTTLSLLVSGVLYPTTVLPEWLQSLSVLLPLTHTIEALRGSLLDGASGVEVAAHIAALAGFSLLLPMSIVAFELAVRQAKVAGSLAHY